MKVSKKDKMEVDLLKPIDKENTVFVAQLSDPGNCFGKEYDIQAPECRVCSMFEICGIYFADNVKAMATTFEKEVGPFIDQADFSLVDQNIMNGMVDKGCNIQDLLSYVRSSSNLTDDVALLEYMKRYLKSNNLMTEQGIVKRKENG